jgi:hypothetical protein
VLCVCPVAMALRGVLWSGERWVNFDITAASKCTTIAPVESLFYFCNRKYVIYQKRRRVI